MAHSKRKFNEDWLNEPQFSPWLAYVKRDDGTVNEELAWCKT